MKKALLTFIAILFLFQSTYAQWTTSGTNIYYNTGNVSIGTSLTGFKLLIGGSGVVQNLTNLTDQDLTFSLTSVGASDKYALIAPSTPTNLAFGVGLVEKMRITTSGYIGMGTTTPNYTLQLGGNIWSNLGSNYTLAVAGDVAVGNATSGSQPKLTIIEGTHGTGTTIQKFNGYTTISDGQGVIDLSSAVGIGTTTPKSNFHLMGSFITSGGNANLDPAMPVNIPNYLANTGQMLIGWNRTAGAGETDFIANQGGGGTGGFAFYNHDNSNNENQLMWILGSGNVLIGKSSQANSSYKLDVNGNVRANQITVNTTGADFVFNPTYRLHSLSFLKKYIDQNHHLPEIPSAKQMQAEGLNVGDNQVKLLQKVEELTLYLIELKKENETLKQNQKVINAKLKRHHIN